MAKRFTDQASQDRYYGRLLGYPECCIEFYVRRGGCGALPPPSRWLEGPVRKIATEEKLPRWICGPDKLSRMVFVPCDDHWNNPPEGYVRVRTSQRIVRGRVNPCVQRYENGEWRSMTSEELTERSV